MAVVGLALVACRDGTDVESDGGRLDAYASQPLVTGQAGVTCAWAKPRSDPSSDPGMAVRYPACVRTGLRLASIAVAEPRSREPKPFRGQLRITSEAEGRPPIDLTWTAGEIVERMGAPEERAMGSRSDGWGRLAYRNVGFILDRPSRGPLDIQPPGPRSLRRDQPRVVRVAVGQP